MFKKSLLCLSLLFLVVTTVPAREVGRIDVPETLTLEDGATSLVLNGAGVRSRFGFKVYVGSLYLKEKSSDSKIIAAADEPMAITMVWVRDIPLDKITDVYVEAFKYAAINKDESLQKNIDAFMAALRPCEKNAVTKIVYIPGKGTSMYYNDTQTLHVEGMAFKESLFRIWLLEEDTFTGDKTVRAGMLGK